jgi:peptidoglycan/xylan/chitin deacetylase (PgdA/CDA1 family)
VAVKRAAAALGQPSAASRILTYHSVGARDHEMNVAPDAFRAQMEWLAASQEVITLADAADAAPGVAVTFDDGYRDNLVNAVPILREFGIPATVFVVAGRVGQLLDHDTDPDTSRLMSWDELRELASFGVRVGAHSLTHRRLALLDERTQHDEIAGCADLLRQHLGKGIDAFAYPFGTAADYSDTTIHLVQECRFRLAVSNRYGPNAPGADRWTLRRIWIDASDSLPTFQAKVTGRLDSLALLESDWGLRARNAVNWLGR